MKTQSKTNPLGVKIGTKQESLWTGIKNKCSENIENSEIELVIQREILKLANLKIIYEKANFGKK